MKHPPIRWLDVQLREVRKVPSDYAEPWTYRNSLLYAPNYTIYTPLAERLLRPKHR